MAYCKRCGAYIPDGLSACLACGYDESAETNADNGGTATARDRQNEDFRLKYEEERRKRQEENLRWAEEERRRRDEEERRKLEEERRRLEEERKRLEQERILNEASSRRRSYSRQEESRSYSGTRSTSTTWNGTTGSDEKGKSRVFAALSYLSGLWVLPLIFRRDDHFARYHARQGLGLFLFGLVCDAVGVVAPLVWLARFYFIYKGMMNALNDRETPLPLFGKFFEKN